MSDIIPQIAAGLASAKTLFDILKGAKDLTDSSEMDEVLSAMNQRLFDLQRSMLEVQQTAGELLQERDQAQRDLVGERNKNNLCQDYELVEPRVGVFLYTNKHLESATTPRHYACPNCFTQKTISILQQPSPTNHSRKCPHCSFSCDTRTEDEMTKPRVVGRIRNWR